MKGVLLPAIACGAILMLTAGAVHGQSEYRSSADFTRYAQKLRETAILHMETQVIIPTSAHGPDLSAKYPWKTNIVTTVFWIGSTGREKADGASAWDPKWEQSYGGFDNPAPASRHNFVPVAFVPRLNPFYIALPYNDVVRAATKPEAKVVIPWFRDLVDRGEWQEGQSVCRNRWIAIRSNSNGKVCYAQWSDCGPFHTDHWQYVFGNEKPRPNSNGGTGLNVSPAVRDYLELKSTDVTDWKFVEVASIPAGPWSLYGENNPLAQKNRQSPQPINSPPTTESAAPLAPPQDSRPAGAAPR